MSANNNDYLTGEVECDSYGRCIERVGYANHRPVGIEIQPTDEGGWDVVACFFDDDPYVNDCMSIGNAEEINNFATKKEARIRGIQIIEEELGPVIS